MEVRIGVQNALREVTFDSKVDQDTLAKEIKAALADGEPLTLVDDKGSLHIIPAPAVAYVELGESSGRRVGFGT